jgi:hypothetical protein
MLMWVIAGLVAVSGAPWPVVLVAAVVAVAPFQGSLLLIAVAVGYGLFARTKSRRSGSEAVLLRSLAGVVTAGGSLRDGIAQSEHESVTSNVRRLCAAGGSVTAIGRAIEPGLPINGRRFASMCAMSEHTGSSIAPSLVMFAARAKDAEDRDRQRRASLAQVRFSAWVVGVAPLALTALVVGANGIPEPGGAAVVIPMAVGAVLQISGTVLVFVISGRVAT